MGIMPDPGSFNNHCPLCWPVDKTPQLLKVFISGVEKSSSFPGITEPAPNGYLDLTQNIPTCEWSGSSDLVDIGTLNFNVSSTDIKIFVPGPVLAFSQNIAGTCHRYFENVFQNPSIFAFNFGWAFVSTAAEMQTMIELATPITGPNPRMELFAMENDEIVVKFCNTQDGTNIKMKINTTLL